MLLPVEKQKELIHGYYAAMTYADAQVGVVLGALRALNLADSTIVVVVGDHGWHLGDHNLWCKHTNFEHATRTPIIITPPKMKGAKTDAVAEFVDIFPTLCELANLDIPEELEGTSLVPVMKNPERSVKECAVSQYPRGDHVMGYSIRTDRYRYTLWFKNAYRSTQPYNPQNQIAAELYDYDQDPDETRNVVNDPEYKDASRELHRRMLSYFEEQAE